MENKTNIDELKKDIKKLEELNKKFKNNFKFKIS